MNKLLTSLFTIFVLSVAIIAQTPDFQTIKTAKGMMVLNNSKVQPFSFLVPGDNATGSQNDDGSLIVKTDTGVAYVYFVKTSAFLDNKKAYTEAETLAAHRDWDIAAQEKAWKAKLNGLEKGESFIKVYDLTNKLFPTNLIPTVNWLYTAPKPGNTDRTIYQTVLLGDTLLMLGAVFPANTKPEQVRTFFKQTLESITLLPPQTIVKTKAVRKTIKRKRISQAVARLVFVRFLDRKDIYRYFP